MKKRDKIFLSVVFIFSAAAMLIMGSGNKGAVAVISIKDSEYGRYSLDIPRSIHIVNENGIVNDLEIEDGCIYMKNASCPGKDCVKCGRICRDHESICCAPAGLIVTIESGEGSKYDAVTK